MLLFNVYFDHEERRAGVRFDRLDFDQDKKNAACAGISLPDTDGNAHWFPMPPGRSRTVGKTMAWCKKLNADIAYTFYEDQPSYDQNGYKIVDAFLRASRENPLRWESGFVDYCAERYVGKFMNDGAFIRHFFQTSGSLWMYNSIDWNTEAVEEFMDNFLVQDGYYFQK